MNIWTHNKPSSSFLVLLPGVLRFHLLDDLFAEAADLGGARDGHVLRGLVLTGHPVKRAARLLKDETGHRSELFPTRLARNRAHRLHLSSCGGICYIKYSIQGVR